MRVALFIFAVVASVSACPPGYSTWFDGWCLRFKSLSQAYYNDAFKSCLADGAELATIRNKKENDEILAAMKAVGAQTGYNFWIGLSCDKTKNQFVWPDGSVANWTNFPNSYDCDDSHFVYESSGLWYKTTSYQYYAACMQPTRSDSKCDDYAHVSYGSGHNTTETCVKVYSGTKRWIEAQSQCRSENANLASIPNLSMNTYIRRQALGAGLLNGLHIGLSDQNNNNGTYTWSDGSNFDYKNFAPGFPNSDDYGQCVAMQTDSTTGRWMNVQCNGDVQLPYACGRDAYTAPSTSQPTKCPVNDEFKDGDDIYSPGFPAKTVANIHCSYTLLAKKGQRVSVEVATFEINACCDSVTLYEGLFGTSAIATLTGFITPGKTYTSYGDAMRIVYNVTSATHVRGVHFKMHAV